MNQAANNGKNDVREALILAGIELLAEQDTAGLNLRRIAARAGVSHAAPAHHFVGLAGLRHAIAQRGFAIFADILARARDIAATQHDFERLETISLAYIEFAASRTALFRLMFDELRRPTPELGQVATRSYMILRDACAPFSRDLPTDEFETTVWAMTHGYASLDLGRERPASSPFVAPDFGTMLRNLVEQAQNRAAK